MPIPKIIIQTWKTSDLPTYYKKTQGLMRRNNPEYKYLFFDDEAIESFIRSKYPEQYDLISKFKRKIQIIDLFRLLAVYEYGGFYFDMDVEILDNLDDLLEYDCVFPVEMLRENRVLSDAGYSYNLGNYAFGASPKNPVIWNIVQEITKALNDPLYLTGDPRFEALGDDSSESAMHEYIYHTTGPIIVSKAVFDSLVGGHSIKLLYPKNWPSRSSWFKFGTYAKHTMTGTWKPNDVGKLSKADITENIDSADFAEKRSPTKIIIEGMGKAWGLLGIENMSNLSDDPESVLIVCIVSSILMILFALCLLSVIGCDDGYDCIDYD